MKFEFSEKTIDHISADVIVVFALQKEEKKRATFLPLQSFQELDQVLDGELTRICKLEQFVGKRKQLLTIYPQKKLLATKIIVVGLGKKEEFVADDLRRSMGVVAKKLHYTVDSLILSFPDEGELGLELSEQVHVTVEGLLLGTYEFGKYKKQEKEDHVLETIIVSEQDKKRQKNITEAIEKAELYAAATRVARDLVNEQPAVATPTYLAKLAQDIAKSSPLITCRVIDKAEAAKLGMEAFLGIARASDTPPKFIYLRYTPKTKAKRQLALIGKGITFDSGGINVKPGDHMQEMKMDMAGGAAVLGVFSVIASLKPTFPVMGIIAATPNMISGSAIVPGDVVRAMNGKTIEILNTDAEGRVTMADSLSFAVKEGATEIIDLATLTGACIVALGDEIAGLFPNNQELAQKVKAAAHDAGEKVWELPMDRDYRQLNNSSVADIANIASNRYGGAITAGLFLESFVSDKPFVHLDIAGPAFTSKGSDISTKGGTGFGVRTVLNLLTEKEIV